MELEPLARARAPSATARSKVKGAMVDAQAGIEVSKVELRREQENSRSMGILYEEAWIIRFPPNHGITDGTHPHDSLQRMVSVGALS